MDQKLPSPTEDETTTMDVEVTQTAATTGSTAGKSKGILYVAVDGKMSQLLEIRVKKGDSIPTIRKTIKSEGSPAFDSVPVSDIELFQSKEATILSLSSAVNNILEAADTPLDATDEWSPEVSWGTKKHPLIVYTPKAINSGKCILFSSDTTLSALVQKLVVVVQKLDGTS